MTKMVAKPHSKGSELVYVTYEALTVSFSQYLYNILSICFPKHCFFAMLRWRDS